MTITSSSSISLKKKYVRRNYPCLLQWVGCEETPKKVNPLVVLFHTETHGVAVQRDSGVTLKTESWVKATDWAWEPYGQKICLEISD